MKEIQKWDIIYKMYIDYTFNEIKYAVNIEGNMQKEKIYIYTHIYVYDKSSVKYML